MAPPAEPARSSPSPQFTELLLAWRTGDRTAFDQLVPMVHGELLRLARRYLRGERHALTLQTTALVNEAYLRLRDLRRVQWQDRGHFFAIAARLMRRVLVDHARAKQQQKRGGGLRPVPLDDSMPVAIERGPDLVALDDALDALARVDPRKAKVVELRFFGGLDVRETAEALAVSVETVARDWRLAKLWLLRELTGAAR